jgi:hypothetical protein
MREEKLKSLEDQIEPIEQAKIEQQRSIEKFEDMQSNNISGKLLDARKYKQLEEKYAHSKKQVAALTKDVIDRQRTVQLLSNKVCSVIQDIPPESWLEPMKDIYELIRQCVVISFGLTKYKLLFINSRIVH